jgi:hypothetical protein
MSYLATPQPLQVSWGVPLCRSCPHPTHLPRPRPTRVSKYRERNLRASFSSPVSKASNAKLTRHERRRLRMQYWTETERAVVNNSFARSKRSGATWWLIPPKRGCAKSSRWATSSHGDACSVSGIAAWWCLISRAWARHDLPRLIAAVAHLTECSSVLRSRTCSCWRNSCSWKSIACS